jgi:hypothetical protein
MINKIINFLSKWQTIHLVMLPVVIGILIMLISIGLGNTGHIGNEIGRFLLPLGFFVWGFMGLPMIIRKETPWFMGTIKGWIGIAQGVILLLMGWGLAIGFLILMLNAN